MTTCKARVARMTVQPYIQGRRLVVAIDPGDLISIREERTQRWYSMPISAVYIHMVKKGVEYDRAQKQKERQLKNI